MSAEPWYPVGPADVFPEEFATFLLGNDAVRKSFNQHHADLLSEAFWNQTKSRIAAGHVEDVFPYPESMRFRNRAGRGAARLDRIAPRRVAQCLQVGTGAELPAGAGEHGHAQGRIGLEGLEGGAQRQRGRAVYRIATVRALQGDREHRRVPLDA